MSTDQSRRARWRAGRVLLGVLMMAGVATAGAQSASADVNTISFDNTRNAWRADEAALAPPQIPAIHQNFSTGVSGAVLAQPVISGSTVIVATENDMVYGIDRISGAIKWSRSVGSPEPASSVGCQDIRPSYGVTSTPVVDPASGTVYVSARNWDGANAQQRIFALNVSNGAVQSGWPVVVAGTASNDATTTFNPNLEFQRPGLLLLNGRLYAAFGSMCDLGDYRGWVVGVSTSSRSQTRWVDEANPGGGEANILGGIWQAGSGLASDPAHPGSILFASGNGTPPPPGPGSTSSNALGMSVVRLQVAADGTLHQADHFTPFNADDLSAHDKDLGSSAPIMLPDNFGGVTSHPHMTFLGSKQGVGYLLDRDKLGGRAGAAGPDNALAEINTGAVWCHPAAWGAGYIYLTTGPNGPVKAYQVGVNGQQVTLSQAGATADSFSIFSGCPVITSDGTNPGSAVMWVVVRHHNDFTTPDSELRAYNATPAGGTLQLLQSWPIGVGSKFAVPATDGGQVFVGTQDGQLLGFSAAPNPPTNVTAQPGNGSATVNWSPAPGATSYTVTSYPPGGSTTVSGTSATVTGLTNGNLYTFSVSSTNASGTGPPSAPSNVVVPSPPPSPTPGGVTLDGFGGLHPFGPLKVNTSGGPAWPGWNIARGVTMSSDGSGGYVLDGWGGIHPYGSAQGVSGTGYWPGWDITRGIVTRSDGHSGYVLDGWGGVHPFGGAPNVSVSGYWQGWDIARGIVLRADGHSGYVLDGWGGVHPFGGAPNVSITGYWSGWDIARGLTLRPDGQSGQVLDGWGALHPYGGAPVVQASGYWPGWDIARGLAVFPTSTIQQGNVIDGWGGGHTFGTTPPVGFTGYLPGQDVFRGIAAGG